MRIIKEKKIVDPNAKPDLFSVIFSSCFFIGYIPKASGTFGSLFALMFFFIPGFQNTIILFVVIIICFTIGIFTSSVMMKKYGDDPSVVVIDEAAGMWLTVLIFISLNPSGMNLFYLFVCFITFRFFDIVKIQPAKFFDKMNSGLGIMTDDIISGIYAGATSFLISLTKFNPF